MLANGPFQVIASRMAWECPWYGVRRDELRLADGSTAVYNVVTKPDAVFVIPLTAVGEIVLIRHYRHTVGAWCWEIPAGSIKAGQAAAETAADELREEIGGTAEALTPLGECYAANGFCSEKSHLFLATGVTLGVAAREPLEVLEIHVRPFAAAVNMAQKGEITDAVSALAILLAAYRQAA